MLSLQLLREASQSKLPSNKLVRASVQASHALSLWASDPDVDETEAAPVIAEAAERVRELLNHVRMVQSTPVAKPLQTQLHDALLELESLLAEENYTEEEHRRNSNETGDDDDGMGDSELTPSNMQSGTIQSLSAQHRRYSLKDDTMTVSHEVEDRAAALKGAKYMRWYLLILIIIVILYMGGTLLLGLPHYHFITEEDTSDSVVDLLTIGIDSLDALYVKLIAQNVDVKYSGLTIAAKLLSELSTTRARVGLKQTSFLNRRNSLFEFRAASQDFADNGRVLSVETPRVYGRLCQQNLSYPIRSINDAGWPADYVIPVLTPFQCANDAGPQGLFADAIPPYRWYSPYVRTYRRTGAHLANYYHSLYGVTLAVTLCRADLEQFTVPKDTLFGSQNYMAPYTQHISNDILKWCLCCVVGTFLLFVVVAEVMACVQFRYSSIVFTVVNMVIAAVGTFLAIYAMEVAFTDGLTHTHLMEVEHLVTCLTAGLTSETLVEYDAVAGFATTVLTSALEGKSFIYNKEETVITPSNMADIAEKIKARSFMKYRRATYSGIEGGYVYSSMYQMDAGVHAVVVNPVPDHFHIPGKVGMIIGCAATVGVFSLLYFYLTPLTTLLRNTVGSPFLLYKVPPHRLRYVLYGVLLVGLLIVCLTTSLYSSALMRDEMLFTAGDTLAILGSMIRAPSIVDVCIGSCSFPSMLTGLFFAAEGTTGTQYLSATTPYPVPTEDSVWARSYFGAQMSLSSVPTIIYDSPFFSTPLVNASSGSIDPSLIVRSVLATSDINATHGFSIERVTSHDGTYAFVARTLGLSLAIGGWFVGVTVLELLYGKLQERRWKRESTTGLLGAMLAVVLVLAALTLVNAGIQLPFLKMQSDDFADGEISILLSALIERLETYALGFTKMGAVMDMDGLIAGLMVAVYDIFDAIISGSPVYTRLLLLEEYPLGVGTVKVLGTDNNGAPAPVINVGRLDRGTIPVCSTWGGNQLDPTIPGVKRFCYVEIPINVTGPAGERLPRLFALILRNNEAMVNEPPQTVWRTVMMLSIPMCILLALFFGLVLWYVMHAADAKDYVVYTDADLALISEPVPRHYQSVDHFIPRRYRMYWLVACALAALPLVYYGVTALRLMHTLQQAVNTNTPYETQEESLSLFGKNAITHAYNFVVFSEPAYTTDAIATMSRDLETDRAVYVFLNDTRRDDMAGTLSVLQRNMSVFNYIATFQEMPIARLGYSSYQSYMPHRYANFTELQDHMLALGNMVYNTVLILVSSAEQSGTALDGDSLVQLMFYTMNLRDQLRHLYTLDIATIAAFLVASGESSANEFFPLATSGDPVTDGDKAVAKAIEARDNILGYINTAFDDIMDISEDIFVGSDLMISITDTVTSMKASLPGSYALGNLRSDIWESQQLRCREVNLLTNRTAQFTLNEMSTTIHNTIVTSEASLAATITSEIVYRKMLQLTENIREKVPIETERTILRWESMLSVQYAQRSVRTVFGCTLFVLILWIGSLGGYYALMRESVKRWLRRPKEALPLTSGPTATSALLSGSTPLSDPSAANNNNNNNEGDNHSTLSEEEVTGSDYRPRVVLAPFLVIACIALVPIVASFLLMRTSVDVSIDPNGGNALGLRTVMYAVDLANSCEEILYISGKSYILHDLPSLDYAILVLVDRVARFANAFLWRVRYDPEWEDHHDRRRAVLEKMLADATLLHRVIQFEINQYKAHRNQTELHDFGKALGTYALSVINTMTDADMYTALSYWGLTSQTGGLSNVALAQHQDAKAAATAATTPADLTTAVRNYREVLRLSSDPPLAEMRMWRVGLMGARTFGVDVALEYQDFDSLVGPDALDRLTDAAWVAEKPAITAYFADVLAATDDRTQLITMFEESPITDLPANPSSLYDQYVTAAVVASYYQETVTETTFRNIFAFNRRMTSSACKEIVDVFGENPPSISGLLEEILEATERLMASGVDGIKEYSTQPAEHNKWIWVKEIVAETAYNGMYSSIPYMSTAVEWCVITSFWALLVAVCYGVYSTQIVGPTHA